MWLLGGNIVNSEHKTSQPRVQSGVVNNQPAFQGWNVISALDTQWAAANDFTNTDLSQVNAIDWWGSYVSWNGNQPPAAAPSGFWFGIYDNAAGKPGNLLWSYSTTSLSQTFAGYDVLDSSVIDSMFSYSVDLPQDSCCARYGCSPLLFLRVDIARYSSYHKT